ncbi:hypothetical protein [Rhizobium leguminosarum]|uniref:hypothetical protein n=1 Tax=Rhizobium leguminosarum TaxID=384 RepID=UPI0010323691|nr:hypothetical protein [Rhizobium leguminosarum]TAZ00090.1 hypothetical protein ELH79_17055 [Rhizobium leguminosarum]TAZ10957.1 hypothetical protein ELH78_17935 [Rhizobium leguminosarum]
MQDEYQPKYKWRETWPEEGGQGFEGIDGGECFGRVQLDTTTSNRKGMWRWNPGFEPWVRERIMPQQGWEETAREASRRAEEHHDRLKQLHRR